VPRPRNAAVVTERLESRNRLLRDARDLLRGRVGVGEDPEELALDERAQLEPPVAFGPAESKSLLEHVLGRRKDAGSHESDCELEEGVASGTARPRQQRHAALEQIDRGGYVVARERLPAGGREQLAGPLAQRAGVVVERAKLVPIAVGLLEVVAMELLGSVVQLEPADEALVEVGTCPLGDSGVGRIPDERVPEPEAVLAGNARRGRLDQLPADEPEQRRPEGLVPAVEGGHCAWPEFLAHDSCPLDHLAFHRLEAIEPRGEKGLDRRRQRDELDGGASLVGEHRYELLGVERITLRHLRHAGAELG
jgi:hypothetical protein